MKKAGFFLLFLCLSGLTSCNLPFRDNNGVSDKDIEQQYQAVSVLLTQTAQALKLPTTNLMMMPSQSPTVTSAARPSATAVLLQPAQVTATPRPIATQTVFPAGGKAQAAPCDLAQPGRPIDITIPDDTVFRPGEYFSKTWRLVNAGSCSWKPDYAVVWFSGSNMGLNQVQPLNEAVMPGASIDVTVDMTAPQEPGTYQSNWKMRNQQGALFGIGPNGNAPFWVRVVVVPLDTPTVTPPAPTLQVPTATQTPVVFASGTFKLSPGVGVNLDSGQTNQPEDDDLILQGPAESEGGETQPLSLDPKNGARISPFGVTQPDITGCQQAQLSDAPIGLDQYQPGFYLCYRTSKGLPGWVSIVSLDTVKNQVGLQFLTWAVP